MSEKTRLATALIGIVAVLSFTGPSAAGTCQSVKAKGVAPKMATAQAYAQADLKQTAKSMKGRVTQATTNCEGVPSGYRCKIDAVVCPK
jgi:hypothetical protein